MVLVETVQPPRQPSGAGLEHTDAQARMAIEDALDDETRQRQHHLERMADDVRGVPRVEAVAGERRSPAAPFVEREGDVEFFERGEDAFVVRMMQRPALRRVGADHRRPHAVGGDDAAQLFFGQHGIVQRDDGDTEQAAVAWRQKSPIQRL